MVGRKTSVAVFASLALLLVGCGAGGEENADASAPAQTENPVVVAAEVSPAAPNAVIKATGTIVYDRETTLAFKTGGVVAQVDVDEGDVVKAGQRIARLDLTELGAGVAQAQAAVSNADAQYERTRALVEKGHVAQARLDDAALARDQAKANLDAVAFNRNQGVIIASGDGIVLRRFADPGQTVAPGGAILQIGESKAGLVLRVPVSAAEAARVKIGDPSTVSINGLDGPALTGAVVRIAAKSDEATGSFEVDLSVADGATLRSGLVGDAQITTSGISEGSSNAVSIPTLALIDARADQGYVYVIDDKNVAHRRAVATSGIERGSVLVVSGLAAGERIVAEGAAYVRDGEAVTISDKR